MATSQLIFFTRISLTLEEAPDEEFLRIERQMGKRMGRQLAKNYRTIVKIGARETSADLRRFCIARLGDKHITYCEAKLGVETISNLLDLRDQDELVIVNQALRDELRQILTLLECADSLGRKFCFIVVP